MMGWCACASMLLAAPANAIELHAFDVDLDQIDAREIETIKA